MRTEPICIYCTSPGPFTNEHPIPACFGEFKELPVLKDRLCRNCNNTVISRMEQQLCRCGPEGFLRSALGIRGRESHEPVNPFLRGSSGARAIDLVAPLPETLAGPQEDQIPILWEFNPGGETIREVRQIILRDEQGCWHQIRIQLATAGHPICGEREHLPAESPARGVVGRLALQSALLLLRHPESDRPMTFELPLDKYLAGLLGAP